MTKNGWRTILIESSNKLSFDNENLVIETETDEKVVPIEQIGILLIDESKTMFSTKLISKLTESNVKVIFCNEKHTPHCEIIPYYANSLVTANFKKQVLWSEEKKAIVWQKIVKEKITAQANLIKDLDNVAYEKLIEYHDDVLPNDTTNRESQAARLYFNTLFGKSFKRRAINDINSALNYGYAIILSTVNRFVSMHGYHTALGINHKSDDNPYNLSCDLMEPFRPYIDEFVYQNIDRELDIFYKREIINILYSEIFFENKKTLLISAIEVYVEKTLGEMSKAADKEVAA